MPVSMSMRDQYILAQALTVAIREMNKVPLPQREVSNIKDMKRLLDRLFPQFKAVLAATQAPPPPAD